jgi:tetratricopeptide (TPR) repeat protein
MIKNILTIVFLSSNLLIFGQTPTNEIPMYGLIQKTDEMKAIDNKFIERCRREYRNQKEASEAHVRFGWGYLYRNDLSTAIKRLNQAWMLDSTNCNCYFGFAACMILKEDSIQTEKYLMIAKSHDSGNLGLKKYYFSLAALLEDKGLINKAIGFHKQIISIDSSYAPSLKQLGYLYMNIKDSTNSIKFFNKAINLNPRDSLSYLNRGWLFYENKLYNKAIVDFTKAIEIQPTYISAYANRAFSFMALADYNNAIIDFNKCISLVPTNEQGQFYRMIGMAKIKANDKTGGCECLKKSIELGDTYKDLDKKELKKYYKENCK